MCRRKQRPALGHVSGLRCVRGWQDGEVPALAVSTAILVTFLSLIWGHSLLSVGLLRLLSLCLNVRVWLRCEGAMLTARLQGLKQLCRKSKS